MKNAYLVMLALIVAAGCVSQPVASNATAVSNITNVTFVCDKGCFISIANNCGNASILFTNDAGTFNYSTSRCVFTKTLVSLKPNETQEMKNALERKNMTCAYEKGKFDQRLVNSLVFGMEYCEGDLKEALGELIVFS